MATMPFTGQATTEDGAGARALRAGLAILVAAALVAPAPSRAAHRSFASGSLVIPASIEYQSDSGLLASYALVYTVLYLNSQLAHPITFYWAIEQNKLSPYRCDTTHINPNPYTDGSGVLHPNGDKPSYSAYNDNDGCDFFVQRATADGGQPVKLVDQNGAEQNLSYNVITYDSALGPQRTNAMRSVDSTTQMVKYLGGSWIVDSTDSEAFLALLANAQLQPFHQSGPSNSNNATNNNLFVNIHKAMHDFTAPVASVLRRKPPLIGLVGGNGGDTAKLTDVLVNAGLCSSRNSTGAFANCAGVVYDDYTGNPAALLGDASSAGLLNNTDPSKPVYGLLWLGDGASVDPTYQIPHISTFLDNGNNVFAEYDSIGQMESGLFQSTAGVNNVPATSQVPPNEDCNDSSSFFFFTGNQGNGCVTYSGANLPFAQAGNYYYQSGGNGNWEGYAPAGGSFRTGVLPICREGTSATGSMIASAMYKFTNGRPDASKGIIMYLAGHKYDNPPKYWGERLILNTVFAKLMPPTGTELSRSEPVAYVNAAAATTRVYQGTYVEKPTPDTTDYVTYNASNPTVWLFPFMDGHLYQYDASALSSTAQAFADATRSWDAGTLLYSGVPMPAARTIWTYVPRATSSPGSANLNWKKIDFKYTEVTTGCTADASGVCQLSKALLASGNAAGIKLSELGSPTNAAQAQTLAVLVSQVRGACAAHDGGGAPIYGPTDDQCDARNSSDTSLPTLNRARLGGIDHGSPAVVGPSRYVTDAPYAKRPVVAYAAGHDGMLHAFWISDWDGGATHTWPTAPASLPNVASLNAVTSEGQELWALVPPGQLGWLATNNALVDGSINVVDVFGDFPRDANGDGVIDWTATCPGASCEKPTGIRSWHTVLVVTGGRGSSQWGIGGAEMFALDVTNPLNPVLLWHVGGATDNDGRWDNNGDGLFGTDTSGNVNEVFNPGGAKPTDPSKFALKWYDWDDGLPGTAYIPTDYNTTNPTVIDAIKTGRYDYSNLGLAYSTAVAKIWTGGGYQYALFVTTNAADFSGSTSAWYAPARAAPGGLRGAEVFALDLVTGQKLWQWEHLYSTSDGSGVDNSVPPRMALGDIDANGSIDRIYVGDLEGHLWELSARDGRNWNYLYGNDRHYHSLPLFGTVAMTGLGSGGNGASAQVINAFTVNGQSYLTQQPLTTPIGQGRFTTVPSAQRDYLLNRLAVLVGTMGVDWPIAPYEQGHILVIPISPDMGTRLTEPIDMSATRDPQRFGVLLAGTTDHPEKTAWWDIPLGMGERVYGMPRVVNNQIVFNTAFGSFTGDISASVSDRGNFWSVTTNVSTGAAAPTAAGNDSKSFGGVVVVGTDVVISTDDKIKKVSNQVTQGGITTSPFNRATPAAVKSWEVVPP
jgi:type IV pilus assembly protein PilY1